MKVLSPAPASESLLSPIRAPTPPSMQQITQSPIEAAKIAAKAKVEGEARAAEAEAEARADKEEKDRIARVEAATTLALIY